MSDDLGPLPAVHARTFLVQGARNKVASFVTDIQERENLTDLEMLGILNEVQARILKYALRVERHPDNPTKPAGIE